MNYERELVNVNEILPENSGFPAVLHSALVTLPDESSVPGVTPVGLVLPFVAQKIAVKSDLQISANFSAKVSRSTFASYPFSAQAGVIQLQLFNLQHQLLPALYFIHSLLRIERQQLVWQAFKIIQL